MRRLPTAGRGPVAAGLSVLAVLVAPGAAGAAWTQPGTGWPSARALTMPAGAAPTATASNRDVSVSWPQRTLGGGPVGGYVVRRYDASGGSATPGGGCAGTVTTTSCTDTAVPAGSWRYTVEPRHGNWIGAESARGAAVAVAAPTLSVSPTTVGSLPASLSATLASFAAGQTVTFRLDDRTSGTVLSATTTPSTIPSGGGASASVTLPAGTANGSHTVYAIGSGGDVASATVTVAGTYSVSTAAWDLRDASDGSEANVSAQPAFAGDGLTFNTGNWGPTFSTSRYVDFDMSDPLPAGQSVTGATFNYRRSATVAGDTLCLYFEVRRASTGAVLATHGSTAAPVACTTGVAMLTTSTPLPEIDTTDLANDVRIRVYTRSSGSLPTSIDMATVSGSTPGTAFTTHVARYTDAASGTATAYPWSLATLDGTAYQSGSNWGSTFDATRFLRVKFPSYVPPGATVNTATLRHSYRAANSGNTACWYAELYSGGALIGTRGSAAAPLGCNSTASYVTDSVPLPEVTTPARANDLTARIVMRVTGTGSRRTQHDQVGLSVSYGG